MQRFTKLGTIDLRVDYLRPGLGNYFVASANVEEAGLMPDNGDFGHLEPVKSAVRTARLLLATLFLVGGALVSSAGIK